MMSCTKLYVDPIETLTGQGRKNDPSEEQQKFSVSLFGSRSPKLSSSIITNQLARSGSIAGENDSLVVRKPENYTDGFGRCSLGPTVLNWKIVDHSLWIMRPNRIFRNIILRGYRSKTNRLVDGNGE